MQPKSRNWGRGVGWGGGLREWVSKVNGGKNVCVWAGRSRGVVGGGRGHNHVQESFLIKFSAQRPKNNAIQFK